jgi:predicted phage terminase large subunit-like protein
MATRGVTQPGEEERPAPYLEQREFMGRAKRFYGFVSGTGAGKTFSGVYRLWLNATGWNPYSMGAIIVPDKSQFIDNVKPIMEDFGLMDAWEYQSVYTDEPGLITSNGQRILILSADNQRQIGRIKGKNLAYVWMDEEAEIPPRARQIAEQRLRVGQYPNLFITTTPDGKNHTYDFFVGDVETTTRQVREATVYESDDRLAVVGVPPEANPEMREEDIASMRKSLPDAIVQQEIEGEFVEIGSGVFKRDMLHFCASDAISPDWNLNYILGVDPATQADATKAREQDSDYWAATLAAVHRRSQQIFVLDTKRQRGMSLKQGVSWLAEIAGQVPSPKLYVESNQAQDWLRQSLADEGLNATPVNSSRNKEERLIDLSIPLEQGTVKFVNHEINGQLGYDPRWQNLIQEMLAFPEGSHDDLLDSLGLTVRNASIGTQSILSANMYGDRDE